MRIDTVLLPCRIGDTMYGIRCFHGVPSIQKGEVSEMFYSKEMDLIIVLKYVCRGKLGSKIFHTYEEASKYLEERGKKDEKW